MSAHWSQAEPGDYAVIGDPIEHSLSPRMHSAAYRADGLNLSYRAIRVPAGEVAEALPALQAKGYRGLNVTVPLKEEVFAYVRDHGWRISPTDAVYGALNTLLLTERAALNTDVLGFLRTLQAQGVTPGASVLLLGAGGTARALLVGLVRAGYQVAAWNRTPERLAALVTELQLPITPLALPDPAGVEAVINTTSASLSGEAVKVPWDGRPILAYDVAYAQTLTPFLASAQAAGCRVTDGRAMLAEQGAMAYEAWLRCPAPRAAMLKALDEHF